MKIKNFIKTIQIENLFILLISFFTIIFLLAYQLTFINPYASTWDQVDFAMAVIRYDLLAMQPHFPGYPYFILGGKLFSNFFDSPAKALTIFNISLYLTTLYPIYKLGRRYLSKEKSILLSVLLYSSSYILLLVNQPISEGSAISIFCWYLWSLEKALHSKNQWQILLPLILLSLLFGIRLSYLSVAFGLIFLFYFKWKRKEVRIKQLVLFSAFGFIFQLIWVLAIALTEGSLSGFFKLALAFTSGHFQDWGGTVSSNSLPFLERVSIFITNNIIWNGILAQSKVQLLLFVIIILFLFYFLYKNKFSIDRFFCLIMVLMVSYFTWALLAQNIDKPRHIIPIVILCLLSIFILFIQKSNKLGLFLLSVYLVTQISHISNLLKEQATHLPATYQLEKYLDEKKGPFIVYTWEESRVFEYLNASFPHKRLQTYEVFKLDSSYYENYEIFITDKVLFGFIKQDNQVQNQVEKMAEFRSNSLFDPVYNQITLYKWKNERGD